MDYLLGNIRAVIFQSALMFRELVPYVLVGAALGAALRCRERVVWLDRFSSLRPGVVTLSAAFLGTVSPLCTMGTVPLLAGLAGRGFPAGAVIAFLAASSMVNPQLLVLTVGTVGVPLALARWAGAVGVGVSAGWLATMAERKGWRVRAGRFGSTEEGTHRKQPRGFWHYFLDHLEFVALHLLFGVILAAMVNVFVPARHLVRWLGPESRFAVVMSALVASPFYVCGGGILPPMQVLMEKGRPAGVVLAFFISGPATRIQALAALSAVLSRRALIVYVVLVLTWAVFLGVLLNRIAGATSPT
jgi:uncharacterized membrane protein YraQ (UPF0718 family)